MTKMRSEYAEQVCSNVRNNISFLRRYRGITQSELARKTGYSPQYISALELNRNKTPSVEGLAKIAEALGTTAGKLIDTRLQKTIEQLVEESFLVSEQESPTQIPTKHL